MKTVTANKLVGGDLNHFYHEINECVISSIQIFNENPTILIPKYFKDIFIDSVNFHSGIGKVEKDSDFYLFGCKVINGFGNKIIIFNEMASPKDQSKYYEIQISLK